MKVLILGGNGYIGSALLDYFYLKKNMESNLEIDNLKIDNLKIVVVDTDYYSQNITKYNDIQYIKAKYQDLPKKFYKNFDCIILLAGQSSTTSNKNLNSTIENNIKNFSYLFDIISKNQKFIYASSSSVYGQTYNKEVDENNNNNNIPYNYYDWSKQTIDKLTLCAASKDKEFYGLRFGTVNGFSRNLRNDLMINSMVYNSKKNGKIFVSNKDINRPILGIQDLCRAIDTIMVHGSIEKSGVYNLNSFNSTVGEISTCISKICNVPTDESDVKPILNLKLQTNHYDFKINSNKFKNVFNFEFKNTLESIIDELLYKWDNIENFQPRIDDNFKDYELIENCRICNNKTTSLLDMGHQPLANSYTKYHNTLDFNDYHINVENTYPLHLHYCKNCFHTQLNCVVSPQVLFNEYVYLSGTSNTLLEYFKMFSLSSILRWEDKNITSNIHSFDKIKILDIACNDASQLDAYKTFFNDPDITSDLEIVTVGVDPCKNIYNDITSKKNDHDIYCSFWDNETSDKLQQKYETFDIIIAQNVFAHVNDVRNFLQNTRKVMNDNSILYIQTSQKDMILENKCDTAYHEHLSFFNAYSMNYLCENNNLYLNNVFEHPIHGTSYIFEISKNQINNSNTENEINKESLNGVYSDSTYQNYGLKCIKYKNNLYNKLIDYKLSGKNIIGFGSTAKGQVILNFTQINNNIIDFIIDENKNKQHLFTPGSNILVTDINILKNINQNTIILIMAWNFEEEIIKKIKIKLKEFNITFPVEICNMDTLKTQTLHL